MIEAFRKRPWLVILLGLGFFLGLSAIFVMIAFANPPVIVK